MTEPSEFAICIANEGYEDLEVWKVSRVLPDPKATEVGCLRVIDASGEDYLYPANYFESVDSVARREPTDIATIHLDSLTKDILRAEAIAAKKSLSALLREWIDERLDLPLSA